MEYQLNESDLHEYQWFGAEFIVDNPQTALFLACGLGKTITTLTALFELMHDRFLIRKALVICPLRVGNVWREEIAKWEHLQSLRISVAIGTAAERLAALERKADIYVLNRENVQWLIEESGARLDFDMLIIDESSSFKNHQTKRFRAIMKLRPKVKRVVLLSATPTSNGLLDLWAQFRLLDMGQRLGRFIGQYRDRFFIPDKRNGMVIFSYKPKPDAESEIHKLISDITVSMTADDYLEMPELLTIKHEVEMPDNERQKYDTLKNDMVLKLQTEDGKIDIDASNAAALSNKLSQMANGFVYDVDGNAVKIHDRKLDILEDLLEQCTVSGSALVAYWYKHDLERIKERLRKLHIPFTLLDTAESIERWNRGDFPVALIHPASAGHGLNLQEGGATLIWFGLTWSLELYQQTNARLWRQGQQSESVVVHHIIARNTIDEQVMKALAKKDKTQSALIEAVKAVL